MKINDLKNKHKNIPCLICGAGPSLHNLNHLAIPKNFITMTVNSAVVKIKDCDYFVSDDIAIRSWDYFASLLPKLRCKKLLYEDKLKLQSNHLGDAIFYTHTWWYSPKSNQYNPDGVQLTKDEPIIGAINSAGSALHLSYIMGCNPIILIGCDCQYKDGHRYYWQYDGEEKPNRIDKSFNIPDSIFEKNYTDMSVDYWYAVAYQNRDIIGKEVEIIDASDGLLDCFVKMNISTVIEKFGNILMSS